MWRTFRRSAAAADDGNNISTKSCVPIFDLIKEEEKTFNFFCSEKFKVVRFTEEAWGGKVAPLERECPPLLFFIERIFFDSAIKCHLQFASGDKTIVF